MGWLSAITAVATVACLVGTVASVHQSAPTSAAVCAALALVGACASLAMFAVKIVASMVSRAAHEVAQCTRVQLADEVSRSMIGVHDHITRATRNINLAYGHRLASLESVVAESSEAEAIIRRAAAGRAPARPAHLAPVQRRNS